MEIMVVEGYVGLLALRRRGGRGGLGRFWLGGGRRERRRLLILGKVIDDFGLLM